MIKSSCIRSMARLPSNKPTLDMMPFERFSATDMLDGIFDLLFFFFFFIFCCLFQPPPRLASYPFGN